MSKNIIYVHSGTGNCLDIAKNIAARLGDTDIVLMRAAPAVTDCAGYERVGFVFPCYAGGLPGHVEEYVRSLQIPAGAYKFAVVSYAGYPGIGLSVLDEIVGLDFWTGISHQSACIWLMPHTMMVPPMGAAKAQARSEKLAFFAAAEIIAKKTTRKKPSAPAFNRMEAKVWPSLCGKKAAGFAVTDACVSCGQCEKLCPRGNIRLTDGRPVFGTDCIQCLSCLQYCPAQAIHMGGATLRRERYHNPNVSAEELMQPVIHVD